MGKLKGDVKTRKYVSMTEAECYKSKEGWQEKYLLLVFNRLFLIPSDVPPWGSSHSEAEVNTAAGVGEPVQNKGTAPL